MSLEAFHHSEPLTLGVELELQLVNTNDYDLAPYAEDMLRLMKKTPLPGSVLALIAVRLAAKALGVGLGNVGSGASWRQALWLGCAMTPMSAVALLVASQFMQGPGDTGEQIARIALPAILVMELLGAVISAWAIYRAGESSRPWAPSGRGDNTKEGEPGRES